MTYKETRDIQFELLNMMDNSVIQMFKKLKKNKGTVWSIYYDNTDDDENIPILSWNYPGRKMRNFVRDYIDNKKYNITFNDYCEFEDWFANLVEEIFDEDNNTILREYYADELIKCKEDANYFIDKYCIIQQKKESEYKNNNKKEDKDSLEQLYNDMKKHAEYLKTRTYFPFDKMDEFSFRLLNLINK